MNQALQAKDIMTADTLTVAATDTVAALARRLVRQGISNAPVVDRSGDGERLLGFVSERDVLHALSDGRAQHDGLTVREIMRGEPVHVVPDTSLAQLASMFTRLGYRHLPVVSRGNQLLGVVSRRDVLAALLEAPAALAA